MKEIMTNYWGRCSRRCWIRKIVLLVAVVILGNLVLYSIDLHGGLWGLVVGILAGCSTWFIPYEATPDVRPNDRGLKITYIDMNVKGELCANVHSGSGVDTGHNDSADSCIEETTSGQRDGGSSPRIAGLLPEISGQPKHEGVG